MPVPPSDPPTPRDRTIRADRIQPDDAQRKALDAVSQLMALEPERWRFGLVAKKPGRPLFVHRIDREYRDYYIVPFGDERRDTARIIIDAQTAEFDEAIAIDTQDGALQRFIDPPKPPESAASTRSVPPRDVARDAELVWQPCDQSTTPFLPFYRVPAGDGVAYIRIDGERFDRLTTGVA